MPEEALEIKAKYCARHAFAGRENLIMNFNFLILVIIRIEEGVLDRVWVMAAFFLWT